MMISWTSISFIILWSFVSIWYKEVPIVGSVENYGTTWQKCRHLDNATFINMYVNRTKTVRSKLDCMRQCTGISECQIAVFKTGTTICHQLQRDINGGGSPFSDVGLGKLDDSCLFAIVRETTQEEETSGAASPSWPQVITDCPAGQVISVCSDGYMGQYCELQNHETCLYPYKLINHVTYDGTTTQKINGRDTMKELTSNAKIVVQVNSNGDFLVGPVDRMYNTNYRVWCGQVHRHLTRESWSSYESNPKIQSYIMSHKGDWHTVTMNLNYTDQQVTYDTAANLQVFIRDPVNVFAPMQTDKSESGSAEDVISAILSGYEPTQIVSTTYDVTKTYAIRHYLKTTLLVSGGKNYPAVPLFFRNMKTTTLFEMNKFQSSLDGQDLTSFTNPKISRKNWPFDPCWYEATKDSQSPYNGPSICHLKAAISSGKRTRAIFDGISTQAVVVYALQDYVLFQARPYMTPKVSIKFDMNAQEVHKIASTDGRVMNCKHRMDSSEATTQIIESTDDVRWFVDSRKWELVYWTRLGGTFVGGVASILKQKVNNGADVQIVVETDEMMTSYRAVWLRTTLVGDGVAAEATGILAISPNNLSFVRDSWCTRRDYLFSTNLGMQYVEYTLGDSATAERVDSHGLDGLVWWYVSEYGAD